MTSTPSPRLSVEYLLGLFQKTAQAIQDAESRCPEVGLRWEAQNDARAIWFRTKRIVTLFQVDYYNLALWVGKSQHKLYPELTKAFGARGPDFLMREYDQFHKLALLIGSYSLLEESLRRICGAMDPTFMSKPRNLAGLTNHLLSLLKLRQYEPLFELQRTLRNTIHNNTVFLPDDKKDRSIDWKGITYIFSVGKRADVASWEFLADHITDLSNAIADIITDPSVAKLPDIKRVIS